MLKTPHLPNLQPPDATDYLPVLLLIGSQLQQNLNTLFNEQIRMIWGQKVFYCITELSPILHQTLKSTIYMKYTLKCGKSDFLLKTDSCLNSLVWYDLNIMGKTLPSSSFSLDREPEKCPFFPCISTDGQIGNQSILSCTYVIFLFNVTQSRSIKVVPSFQLCSLFLKYFCGSVTAPHTGLA